MGYQVKWVEENLGVSRKALRGFEEHGLMPKNENREYRDYSEEDIDRIWNIRILQGMGFSLNEIVNLVKKEGIGFDESIAEKVKQLEEEKERVNRHLGYANAIKMTGRFPSRPTKMGAVTCEEFQEKALAGWNINDDPAIKQYQEMADIILNKSIEEFEDTDLGRLFCLFESMQNQLSNWEAYMNEHVILRAIIDRKTQGANNPEVQLLVKILYENQAKISVEQKNMTVKQFVRFESAGYISGDVARMREREYGEEGCHFIADAIAVFGGYKCYSEIEG